MGLRSSAINVIGRAFDTERRVKQSPVDKIVLLKQDGTVAPYKELMRFTRGFIVRHSEMRDQPYVEIATTDDLTEVLFNTSYIAIGNRVHSVTSADVVPPDDRRFTWRIHGTVEGKEVYDG